MRSIRRIVIAVAASFGLIGSATATEMIGTEIKEFVSGKTVYNETTAASVTGAQGHGILYYAADGSALYKTPKGELWHGNWEIKADTICLTFKEVGKRGCSKFDKQGDTISIIDAENGQVRAKVLKTASGNPENLK